MYNPQIINMFFINTNIGIYVYADFVLQSYSSLHGL